MAVPAEKSKVVKVVAVTSSAAVAVDGSPAAPVDGPAEPAAGLLVENIMDGRAGWVQVLAAQSVPPSLTRRTYADPVSLELFNTFGYINSYGIFEEYYATSLGLGPSTLSWAGSVQVFLLLFVGAFSGRLYDAGYFRPLIIAGSLFQVLGAFTASTATDYWRLFLAQGVCSGLGAGLAYTPVMANVATYFSRYRSLAIAVNTCGSALGGIVYPIVAQRLLPTLGFPWMMRCIGFILASNSALVLLLARQRVPARKSGPLLELSAFREPSYSFFAVGTFLNLWAVYVIYDYVRVPSPCRKACRD